MPPETPALPPTNQPVVVTQPGVHQPRPVKLLLWVVLSVVVLLGVLVLAGHFWANMAADNYQKSPQNQRLAKVKTTLAPLSFAPLITKQQADDQNYVPETTTCDAYKTAQTALSAARPAVLAKVPLGSLLSGAYSKASKDSQGAQGRYATLASLLGKEVTACTFYIQDMKLSDAITNADNATTTVLDPPGFSYVLQVNATTGTRYSCPASKACLTPHSLDAFKVKWSAYATAVSDYQALFANHACYFAELITYCTKAAAAKAQESSLIQAVTNTLTTPGVTQDASGADAFDTAHQALMAGIQSGYAELANTLHTIDPQAPSTPFEDALVGTLKDQFAANEVALAAAIK